MLAGKHEFKIFQHYGYFYSDSLQQDCTLTTLVYEKKPV